MISAAAEAAPLKIAEPERDQRGFFEFEGVVFFGGVVEG
jgi:hypothetical protein